MAAAAPPPPLASACVLALAASALLALHGGGGGGGGGGSWPSALTPLERSSAVAGCARWPVAAEPLVGLPPLRRSEPPPRLSPAQLREIKLWEAPRTLGLGPCTSQPNIAEAYEPRGYLVVFVNGGLNQQRAAICNAVVLARFLNRTLVVPYLKVNPVWRDRGDFEDIFDMEHFRSRLAGLAHIARKLPKQQSLKPRIELIHIPFFATLDWYVTKVAAVVAKNSDHGAPGEAAEYLLIINPFSQRLTHELPIAWQQLRCFINLRALRFLPRLEAAGEHIVSRMRELSGGHYIALHLRFEKDAVAYSMCDYGGGVAERNELQRYRKKHWDKDLVQMRSRLNPVDQRLKGQCPLTPHEAGLFMQAMGIPNDTHIYIAALSNHLYRGDSIKDPLRLLYPNIVDKDQLMTQRELADLQEHSSQLAAVDFLACVEATIFIPTATGNMPNLVMGHRRLQGFKKTIEPNQKRLARALAKLRNGTMWQLVAEEIAADHELRDGAPSLRKKHTTISYHVTQVK
eukprot:SM000250S08718  [mRNA]  locus=s250:32632:35559:+ [translate_table: standard]